MTAAIQALESAGVRYNLLEYQHDPAAPAYGLEAAEKLNVPPARVFKTLVAEVDRRRLVLGLVPVAEKLDLKALAAAVQGREAKMASASAAERATGYQVGGISPLGGREALPVVIDERALAQERILISAGRRGAQLELAPQDLVRLTGARTARLASPPPAY